MRLWRPVRPMRHNFFNAGFPATWAVEKRRNPTNIQKVLLSVTLSHFETNRKAARWMMWGSHGQSSRKQPSPSEGVKEFPKTHHRDAEARRGGMELKTGPQSRDAKPTVKLNVFKKGSRLPLPPANSFNPLRVSVPLWQGGRFPHSFHGRGQSCPAEVATVRVFS
jgi:hypothetical protein